MGYPSVFWLGGWPNHWIGQTRNKEWPISMRIEYAMKRAYFTMKRFALFDAIVIVVIVAMTR